MKGLSFTEPMVKAWLAGNKTVTRRLMKPQPDHCHKFPGKILEPQCGEKEIKPRYTPGELVYIKETWRCDDPAAAQDVMSRGMGIYYKAGMSEEEYAIMPKDWKSPRLMPEWASRSFAWIVSVRPEQIQSITEEEAIKEGVDWKDSAGLARFTARKLFRALWESLHPGTWDQNPWVWRIELSKDAVPDRREPGLLVEGRMG